MYLPNHELKSANIYLSLSFEGHTKIKACETRIILVGTKKNRINTQQQDFWFRYFIMIRINYYTVTYFKVRGVVKRSRYPFCKSQVILLNAFAFFVVPQEL